MRAERAVSSSSAWAAGLAAVFVCLPYLMFARAVPIGLDSGVFMYSGMIINDGLAPYVDAWDHKGPLLYLFNALGLGLFGGPAGVVLLEGGLLFVSLAVSMRLWAARLSGAQVARVAGCLAITYYSIFEGGNLTETWLLPFALVAYSLGFAVVTEVDQRKRGRFELALFGALGLAVAIALLTRPNNGFGLGVFAMAMLALGVQRRFACVALGASVCVALVGAALAWVHAEGAIDELAAQYWRFNISYSSGTNYKERAYAFVDLCRGLILTPLGLFAFAASVLSIKAVPMANASSARLRFAWIMMLSFAADLASQTLSGRAYFHYLLLPAASLTVFTVALLEVFGDAATRDVRGQMAGVGILFVAGLLLVTLIPASYGILTVMVNGIDVPGSERGEIARYLRDRTTSADKVLVHGGGTWILVASDRRSATSITYSIPVDAGFEQLHERYEREAIEQRPLYVIEAPGGCGLSLTVCGPGKPDYTRLRKMLTTAYAPEATLHGYKFWRRLE